MNLLKKIFEMDDESTVSLTFVILYYEMDCGVVDGVYSSAASSIKATKKEIQ